MTVDVAKVARGVDDVADELFEVLYFCTDKRGGVRYMVLKIRLSKHRKYWKRRM